MDQVTRALRPEEIARLQAGQAPTVGFATKAPATPLTFVNGDEQRRFIVPLDYPVEHDGKVYTEVTVRRPLMREWRSYLRACADARQTGGPGAEDQVDQAWLSVPAVVLENLDFADATRVEGAMETFFALSPSSIEEEDASNSESTIGEMPPSP